MRRRSKGVVDSSGLTLLSAFTGAGGMDLGLEKAGFETIGAIEIDSDARKTLEANRPRWPILKPNDILKLAKELTPLDVGIKRGQLTVLAAGPPCQPFSKASQWTENGRQGLKDPRSKCLNGLARLVDTFLPKAVLIENVPGFARHETNGIDFLHRRIKRIRGGHYRAFTKTLDAWNYGVPQRRRRSITVFLRDEDVFEWPDELPESQRVRAWDAIGDLNVKRAPAPSGSWADLLPSIPEGENYLWHAPRTEGQKGLFGYRTRYWSFLLKLAKDRPSWTLSASPGPSTGPFHWRNRPLAVEEMLRLQSFPASWRLEGGHREQVRQVGNATPPLLAEVLGRSIAEQVCGMSYERPLALRISRKRRVPRRSPTRPMSKHHRRKLHYAKPHPGPGLGPGASSRRSRG